MTKPVRSHDLDRLITLLFSMSRQMRERLHHEARPEGLSMVQLGALHMIQEMAEPSMTAIAQQLFITRPSATSLIQSLVRSGHVRRTSSSTDGRSVRLTLTAKGQRVRQKALDMMEQRLRQTLQVLNPSDIRHLYAILTKLIPS